MTTTTETGLRAWTIRLPYLAPPLTLNKHLHRMAEYKLRQQIKGDVLTLLRAHRVPALPAVHVTLHWQPGAPTRRDQDNVVPTLKPIFDAIVDAGVIPDDTPAYLSWPAPVIHPHKRGQRMLWLDLVERPAP